MSQNKKKKNINQAKHRLYCNLPIVQEMELLVAISRDVLIAYYSTNLDDTLIFGKINLKYIFIDKQPRHQFCYFHGRRKTHDRQAEEFIQHPRLQHMICKIHQRIKRPQYEYSITKNSNYPQHSIEEKATHRRTTNQHSHGDKHFNRFLRCAL
ncbi:hypothetical protein QQ045_019822 [Rhodiola kirilowii]